MNRGVRLSALSAAITVAAVTLIGHTIGHLGAAEAESASNESTTAVAFVSSMAQEVVPSGELLEAVRGVPPVACRLIGQALQNRWGRGSVSPYWTLPGDGGTEVTAAVTRALRGEVPVEEESGLVAALDSPDDCERRVAAQLLGRINDSGLAGRLGRIADSGSPRARVGAALALGYGEWTDGIGPLSRALGSSDEGLRATAAWALGRTEHVDAVPPLVTATRDAALNVRANAVVALGWIESSRAVGPLTEALEDAAVPVRINAAWALGQIEDPEAIPALTQRLGEDSNLEVRRAAAWALGRIE